MAENSGAKHAGRWQPGQSGNWAGKPKGARNKASVLAEKLMADDAEGVNAALTAAKSGAMAAARIVLDRLSMRIFENKFFLKSARACW